MKKNQIIKAVSGLMLAALLTTTLGTNVFTTFASTVSETDASTPSTPDVWVSTSTDACAPIATSVNATKAATAAATVSAVTEINSLAVGQVLTSGIEPGGKVETRVWDLAREKGVSVKLFSATGASTTWNFGSVSASMDFDPSVFVGNEKVEVSAAATAANIPTDKYVPVSFAHHGALPGTADVAIDMTNVGKFTKGQVVYLYYYNPSTAKFEYIDDSVYEGHVIFTMTHCSDYIVTGEKLTTNIASSPKTGEE